MQDPVSEKTPKKKIDVQSLIKRFSSTAFLWAIVAGVFCSHQLWVILLFILGAAFIGVLEFNAITRDQPGRMKRKVTFFISLFYMLWLGADLLSLGGAENQHAQESLNFAPEMIGILLTLFVTFLMSLPQEIKGANPIYSLGLGLLGFLYVPVLFGGFMMRLVFVAPDPEASGAWLLLYLALVTKFTDMGAYIMGTLFGRHKMIKHISPGKTWEGTIGSFLISILGGFGVYYFAGSNLSWIGGWWSILSLSIIISFAAIIGDLAESILKRSVAVKDSGATLPGIGGILDLIDSLCFSAPIAYFYLVFFK